MNNILQEEFEKLAKELIAKHDELGMRASGSWAKSLELEINKGKGKAVLLGNDYTEQLQQGRRPGKYPNIKSIEEWIINKPIALEEGMKVSTLAFLIARKIAKEGTKYFQQGGTDLVDAVVTPQRIQKIIDQVSEFQISEFVSDITNVFKEIAA